MLRCVLTLDFSLSSQVCLPLRELTLLTPLCHCPVHFQAWTAQAPHEEVENTREERDPMQIIVSQGA